ncbi:LytR C-terminal domain-containing protein [Corynebacterium sp. YIM 101645]|uniref:LytR C-terminal domain-containing protein n=1 Tax=Corynebacterium lemuris TaxID=1859292 RepID=A0ABT2FX20_9CORY|nr:LytR C-terminal domain-containing protein [Corynebacterium lemuris]
MTNVNPENQPTATESEPGTEGTEGTASRLPLRGLAMVLIAVAALLAMWGLYATTQGNDSTDTAAQVTTEAPATAAATAPEEGEAAAGEDPEQGAAEEGATGEEAAVEDERDEEVREERSQPAPRGGGVAAEPQRLHVLNNSLVPNLAADVAGTLDGEGYRLGEVGNLSDLILPETTVFFQPGNADTEKRARELADRVRGVAREYDPALPEGTDGRNDLTLVLVDQVAL